MDGKFSDGYRTACPADSGTKAFRTGTKGHVSPDFVSGLGGISFKVAPAELGNNTLEFFFKSVTAVIALKIKGYFLFAGAVEQHFLKALGKLMENL